MPRGSRRRRSVDLNPETVNLTFATSPAGLQLGLNTAAQTAPFTKTVIIGSSNSLSAGSPQTLANVQYQFASWSDGGAASHSIVAPATATTYTATYTPVSADVRITKTGVVDRRDEASDVHAGRDERGSRQCGRGRRP